MGVQRAKGKKEFKVNRKAWPKQSVTLYEKPGCRGKSYTVDNLNIEQKCARCFDVCGKKYPTGEELQGHFGSVKASGDRTIVSLWAVCKGTWTYPADDGFLTSVTTEDGCHDINMNWPPVHLQFHLKDTMDAVRQSQESSRDNPYAVNPITDPKEVLEKISYWKLPKGVTPAQSPSNRYVTFLKDCGGFNNIRMGFEYAVLMAWVTGRTLVLPPPEGWYLIDYGPIKRGGSYSKGVTDFKEFFDIEHLKNGLPVITAAEFYEREKDRLGLGSNFGGNALETKNVAWKQMLFQKFGGQPWSPLQRVVLDPSVSVYLASENKREDLLKNKSPVEFDAKLLSQDVIHFPSCHGPNGDQGIYRYLGQIANSVLFADKKREIQFKAFWRDHIHYPRVVFEAAAKMIAKMGLFAYSAVHIRRNDLQYKEVFQNAQKTVQNIEALLYPGEPLYLATDETNDGFFDAIREKHKVYQWKDVVNEAQGVPYSDKVINILEQTICAGGRRFFGTQKSTFTSYIFRMRGYIGAPDTNQYWHNIRYTGLEDVDRFAQPKITGHNYMAEDRGMWEDLR